MTTFGRHPDKSWSRSRSGERVPVGVAFAFVVALIGVELCASAAAAKGEETDGQIEKGILEAIPSGSSSKVDDFVQFLRVFLQREGKPSVLHFLPGNWGNDFQLKLSQKVSVECLWIQDYSDKYSNELLQSLDEENTILFVVDLSDDCGDSSSPLRSGFEEWVVKRQDEWRIFAHPLRWLVFVKECDEMVPRDANAEWMTLFQRANILVDSNVVIADVTNPNYYSLNYIYKTLDSIKTAQIGVWNKGDNQILYYQQPNILLRQRQDLEGTSLRIASGYLSKNTPKHLEDFREPLEDSITKVGHLSVLNLMYALNATPNYTWHRSWDDKGVPGAIARGEAELSGTILFVTIPRIGKMVFTSYYAPSRAKFLFRAPPLASVENILFLPFQLHVWYCSGALLLLVISVFFLVWRGAFWIDQEDEKPFFSDVFIYSLQNVVQMGADKLPKSYSARICSFVLILAMFFLFTSYTAKIIVLSQSTTDVIKTIDDLKHSKLKCGIRNVIYNRYHFARSMDSARLEFKDRKLVPLEKKFMSIEEGVRRMQTEQFAFFVEIGVGYSVIQSLFLEHEKCDLREIEFFGFTYPAHVVWSNSSYKEVVKIGFLRVQETGLRMRDFQRLYTPRPKCESGAGRNFQSMTLNDCSVPISIFLFGSGIALLALLIENVVHKNWG